MALFAAVPSSSQVSILFGDGFEGCSVSAWANTGTGGGAVGAPIAGEPDDAVAVRRYSGRCALLANGSGNYVRDLTPLDRTTYWARIYVYPALSAGDAVFMQFRRDGNGPDGHGNIFFWMSYNGDAGAFELFREGVAAPAFSVPASPNRWYHVALRYSGTPQEFRLSIHGAGGVTLVDDAAIPHELPSNQGVQAAEVGWVTSTSPGSGSIVVDDFVSTSGDSAGRRCRGDADGSGAINILDAIKVSRELNGDLATGQPDCNEDGSVNVVDRVCMRSRTLAEDACP